MQVDEQYIKVKFCAIPHASSKKSLLFFQFWAARGFCKTVLNSRICQHCDVKTSTVTPTFYYFFIIFLTCYISVPSFIYNLCQVLLLRNHLNEAVLVFINSTQLWPPKRHSATTVHNYNKGVWLWQFPRGVLRISSDRNDQIGPKIKTQKNP